MIPTLLSIGFGLVVISMCFLVFVFGRAYADKSKQHDRRYRIVASSLSLIALGVGIWAFNPLSQALGGPPLYPALMFLASTMILFAACLLVGSTALGGDKTTLKAFLLSSVVWTVGCIIWGYISQ